MDTTSVRARRAGRHAAAGRFHLPICAVLALAALAAAPFAGADETEDVFGPVEAEFAWRVSVGYRAAPGIKTSARVDPRAAAQRAGAAPLAGFVRRGASVSASTADLGTTRTGTTEADALAGAGFSADQTRYEFDNGYIDLDDGANIPGETQNWHFEDASAFENGAVSATREYSGTTTTRSRTTTTETSRSSSSREQWGEGLGDSSDDTAHGIEVWIDRAIWGNGLFGIDGGLGFAWYGDVDCFSVRGRAYSASATSRSTSRTTTTETTTTETKSGTVTTSLAQPEFADPKEFANADGSIGGGYVVGGELAPGYQIPVLTVTEDRFSTDVSRNQDETASTTKPVGSKVSTSSRSASRTVDVRSEGTISLQELRLGVRPWWQATGWLALRGELGLLATYSEIETETRLSVDGAPAATIRRDEDDWTLGGYAGLSLALGLTDALELSAGAEARFPHHTLHFDDGVVSGGVELATWSGFAAVAYRF